MQLLPEAKLVVVIVGFVIAFVLACGIGANDVANSFGTSVGSKALSLRTACILATICEFGGAVLMGARVSKTVRDDLINVNMFANSTNGTDLMMNGQLSALIGSCVWTVVATIFKLPISGTHSIVGAVMGFSLVRFGVEGINWWKVVQIAISWFLSPLASGIVSSLVFFAIKKLVLEKEKSLESALMILPFLYGVIIAINVFVVGFECLERFHIDLPLWTKFVVPISSSIITALIVYFIVVPIQRKQVKVYMERLNSPLRENENEGGTKFWDKIKRSLRLISKRKSSLKPQPAWENPEDPEAVFTDARPTSVDLDSDFHYSENPSKHGDAVRKFETAITEDVLVPVSIHQRGSPKESEEDMDSSVILEPVVTKVALLEDRPEEAKVFSSAQILTAMFGSFAHGANDVSNAIGPLIGLWLLATTADLKSQKETPIALLVYGGVGISVGLWIWGRRVIETIGEGLALITPSSGVAIEVGSALTVLVASKLTLPISTTHCKVGSVVSVGRFRAKENVNWRLFLNIVLSWIVTLPISGGISALTMWLLTRDIP